ncbi:MAG: hypothetical protein ACW987_18085 [Candidatus Thorarchaeota archaeon]|jgi:hypothetical protein
MDEVIHEKEIRALEYTNGATEVVNRAGITKIRFAGSGEEIAGSGGYLTTVVVERFGEIWKMVPAWMVTIEFKL